MAADQARSVELLWGTRERPSRGPKPALTLDRIVATAITVADAEGIAAVSMQRVAGELDFTKMSLYRYLPGKAELTALMIDTAIGAPPNLDDVPGDWRPKLRHWALSLLDATRRHPWALAAAEGPRTPGPNELGWMETGLTALAGTGLHGTELLDSLQLVTGHVRGIAQQTVTEQQFSATITMLLRDHGANYPALKAAIDSSTDSPDQDNALDFGLNRIFDGLAQLIATR